MAAAKQAAITTLEQEITAGDAANDSAETAHTAHLASHQQVLDVVKRLKTHVGTGGTLNTVPTNLMETATYKKLVKAAAAAPSTDIVSNQLKPLLDQLQTDLNAGMTLATTQNTARGDTWISLNATKNTNIAGQQAVSVILLYSSFLIY